MAPNRYYKPELDLLRLFAFLCVFFTHRMDLAPIDPAAHYWGHHLSLVGVFGVPLFFFLSAFLITELLTREQEEFGRISVKSFYVRRVLRIWPLYFTFFFGTVALTHLTDKFGHIPSTVQLTFSLFSGNWYITFNEWLRAYTINPLWSVSVEEQLYILLPLIIYFGGKRGLVVFASLALAVAYLTVAYYASHPTEKFTGEWTNSFVQFQFFAAGILFSVYLKGRQPNWHIVYRVALFAAAVASWLVASIVCGVHADSPHLSSIPQALSGWFLILLGVTLFFLAFHGAPAAYMPSALVYLGRISYGMYVFHITTFWFVYFIFRNELASFSRTIGLYEWRNNVGFVLAFIATVTVSLLSYNFFEKPFLRLKTRFTAIPSRD
jgi:peptidoglycan/LPS O-acetylase OafA/YrhL